jgi:uncharacterized protein
MTYPAEARANPVIARLGSYGRSPRILGVDLARGLAVIGMFGAHIGVTDELDIADPSTWLAIVDGRSAVLFATLAGASLAIMTGGRETLVGVELTRARVRIAVRAAIIFAIGGALVLLDTRVAVILPVYAVLFLFAIPLVNGRPLSLVILAGVLALVSPVIVFLVRTASAEPNPSTGKPSDSGEPGVLMDLLVTGVYPGIVWMVFPIVGLVIGRLDMRSPRVIVRLALAGAALMIVGYGGGAVGQSFVSESSSSPTSPAQLLSTEPHSGSTFEIAGSLGFALVVIALCLAIASRLKWLLYPVIAVGAMALTAYSGHIVALFVIGDEAFTQGDNGLYVTFVLWALALCTAWTVLAGRGPLESLVTFTSRRAASLVPDADNTIDTNTTPTQNGQP